MNFKTGIVVAYLYLAILLYCWVFTPNFILSCLSLGLPVIAFKLLWNEDSLNIIFWAVLLQWVSVTIQLVYCNIYGITLSEKIRIGNSGFNYEKIEEAFVRNQVALYFFVVGIFLSTRKLKFQSISLIVKRYTNSQISKMYLIVAVVYYSSSEIIWSFPSVVQILYFLLYVKWGFFVVYIYHTLKSDSPRIRLILILLIELFLSLKSFFAGDVISVFLFFMCSFVASNKRYTWISYLFGTVFLGVLLNYLIIWSAIKQDFRNYVNDDKGVQVVFVSNFDAVNKIFDLVSEINAETYRLGVEKFVDRLGYIHFFAASLEYVPRQVPHQNGSIYYSAIKHYLMPRFIFKDKEALDDSKHTQKYTGIKVSGSSENTSFSLGYVADAYIDFGGTFMFLAVLLFAYFLGFLYKLVHNVSTSILWNMIFTSPFLMIFNINGTDTKKAVGFALIYSLSIICFNRSFISSFNKLFLNS